LTLDAATPCTVIVETGDTEPRADGTVPFSASPGWSRSALTGPGGYASLYADLATTGGASATWTAPELGAVRFAIQAALPDSYAAAGAVYTVHAADGDHVVPIDQGAAKGTWVELGTFEFDAEHPASVTLTGTGGGYLRASAVRFAPA